MTETFGVAGQKMLSDAGGVPRSAVAASTGESDLVDRLIDLVLALEPLELKQHCGGDSSEVESPVAPGRGVAPTLLAESTKTMLMQMRAVLDREAARLGSDGAEGKAAVDQVALIARTLEKIDQMERLIAQDQTRAAQQSLSAEERAQLRQTVRQLILAAAERLALERAEQAGQSETAPGPGGVGTVACGGAGDRACDGAEQETTGQVEVEAK